ncbi:sodium:solute symporter [Flagellimonas olearia]|uniref:Sodium:solute symporter n=1 Tax=Flagellimonas olearia TaxID=552546 RepID=A0A6I1DZJ7_9FLAO|nr:sodium:solute symporter [Allomuricauda olearia]KAB7530267.1 sodium:solute symporter [Allomuricauda olearia]
MNTYIVLVAITAYFSLLLLISYLTSRRVGSETYFTGDRQSPWLLVAFGMIGSAMSGVTFVSLPGMVANNDLYFFQFVLGNVVGYLFITFVLLPIYYRLRLVSIYGFLKNRFGNGSYRMGSLIFLVSQSFGAALRLLLAAKILHFAFFGQHGIPFFITVAIILIFVWLYTNKSGIKTIVWTDTMQTFFLILGAMVTIYGIKNALDFSFLEMVEAVSHHKYFDVFNWEGKSGNNFYKQFVAGVLIAIAMIGLDQNMMQKTLTCKSLRDAQKNTLIYSIVLALTQFLFLGLGVLLYIYAADIQLLLEVDQSGIYLNTDNLFPNLALNHLGVLVGISFLLGIIAASFSSVDSALTALTTSFCYDFLDISHKSAKKMRRIKNTSLVGFSILIFMIIMAFSHSQGDVISHIFRVAGYTYGPLLGMFLFGMFTRYDIKDKYVPILCITAPILTYGLSVYMKTAFNFDFGFMNIAVNGLFTVLGLFLIKVNRD